MFDIFFKSLSDLTNRTAILEACEWDEERYNVVLNVFIEKISTMQKMSYEYSDPVALNDHLSLLLSEDLEKSEIIILLDIFSKMSTSMIKEIKECDYEN